MNKKEIKKLKEELVKERESLREEVKKIKEREDSYLNDKVGDNLDKAAGNSHREVLFYLSGYERQRAEDIKDALNKIEQGNYGICENCKDKITQDRLKAIPYARLCVDCKSKS
ncbi:MAG: TraR/DksA family transcriptional regulator [Elusimicrobiota bacterium]